MNATNPTRFRLLALVAVGAAVLVILLGLLLISIVEHRSEAYQSWVKPGPQVAENESDSSKWGQDYPREYETWKRTAQSEFKSKFGGSAKRDMLQEDPRLVLLWAGYAFAKDYNQGRGHANAVSDIQQTLRTTAPTSGTCWTCKSSNVPALMAEMGSDNFYKTPWLELGPKITQSIGCLDCHDVNTMALNPKRPALHEALARRGESFTTMTQQQKRSLVCAQCHVEYYFKGEHKTVTHPWDKGLAAEDMEAYYDEIAFADWKHSLSKADMIKPQHPDWELFSKGIHAERGLACADCHMPYVSEGGVKYSSHHVRSPLENLNTTCQVCHREGEETLRQNIYQRQEIIQNLKSQAENLLVAAHVEAKAAWDLGTTPEEMQRSLKLIRSAQWRWDFVAASHGAAFHAPLESARLLALAIDTAASARLELQRILIAKGATLPIAMPDLSSKAKAQAYIGLDMEKERAIKESFLKDTLPGWKKLLPK